MDARREWGRWPVALMVWVGSYLYGSLPLLYLLGRWRRVDLRRAGSGNVGATNLWQTGSRLLAVAGWVFDASKGLLPVVAGRRLGLSEEAAALAGACGVAGQCWPVFLGFRGGRGVSAFVGAALAIDRAASLAAVVPPIAGGLWRLRERVAGERPAGEAEERTQGERPAGEAGGKMPWRRPASKEGKRSRWHRSCTVVSAPRGRRSKSVPLGVLLGVLLFPLACRRRGAHARCAPALLSLIVLLRRLTAPLPDDATNGPAVRRVALWYRLLYDRNTAD
jgi:hypothetical protein